MSGAPIHDGRLDLHDVAVMRGGRKILAGVSLSVEPGESVLVRGPNGAGKTTLLRAVAGLLPLASGKAAANGEEKPDERRLRIIYCGHADAVKTPLTVTENLRFWAKLYSAPVSRIEASISALGLEHLTARRAGDLSAGQKRRLGLARPMISGKPVWLLDEPAASIDAASVARLTRMLEDHCAKGGCALIATHDRLDIPGARSVIVEEAP
ncbi:MAG: heme ABC exporter ATP-binding protein CcmA [Pseudomonadota bacterium]|nr:heme ABC exporter ATP-binding protein CcmA [Pseudomonadota bacterium]